MNLIARSSGGANIVARPQARPAWYPAASAEPVAVEIHYREVNADGSFAGVPIFAGRFAPGEEIRLPYNPVSDKKLLIYKNEFSADGTRRYSTMREAEAVPLVISRETEAPAVSLIGAATNTVIELQVTGYTTFARKRKLRTSPNADMSGATVLETDYEEREMPGVVVITRAADPAAETIYVAISHSSGGDYGPESAPQAFTFTDAGGAGGSTGGGGGYFKKDPYDLV